MPGAGLTWAPRPALNAFAGIHRGFAPPRTEDVIGPRARTLFHVVIFFLVSLAMGVFVHVVALLFTSARVVPDVATRAGYEFRHPTLEASLRALRATGVGSGIAGELEKTATTTVQGIYDAVLENQSTSAVPTKDQQTLAKQAMFWGADDKLS